MTLDFSPQFHKRILHGDGHCVWVAVPHPDTLIAVKTVYYQAWQREEHDRLQTAGEDVMSFAISF